MVRSGLMALMVLSLSAGAQVPPQFSCFKCKSERTIPCPGKDHDPKRVCGITIPHKCAGLFTASCCNGIGRILCPDCKDPAKKAELEAEKLNRLAWVDSMSKLDQELGITMVHIESDHYIIHFSIPTWKVGSTAYTRTKAAHLFAQRAEDVASRFYAITGVYPGQKQVFWLMSNAAENMKVTLVKMGGGHRTSFALWTFQCQVCMWPDPARPLANDDDFHPHFVHYAAQTLAQAAVTIQTRLQPWVDEGLAHWAEMEIFKVSRNYCFNEVMAKDPWQMADWRKRIFGEVSSSSEATFASVISLDLDRMKHRDHAYSWSFIDFLTRAHPEEFKTFFAAFKRSNDTKASIDRALGLSTSAFHDEWRAWVLKNYGGR